MRILRNATVILFIGLVTSTAGCGSETTAAAAGGLLAGIAGSKTLAGMQADLAAREQSLIAHYNELVEAGSKADTIEDVKKQIVQNQFLQQGAGVVKEAAGTDWSDPAAAGGTIATVLALAYGLTKRNQLNNTVAGVKTFRSKADEATKQQIDQVMLDKKAST